MKAEFIHNKITIPSIIEGKSETASSRLNLAQGVNSAGTVIGPLSR
jgi:hypothetical protein